MLFHDIVMLAATQNGIAPAGGGGGELFPDPALQDVADSTNGWAFDIPGAFGPTGGTGPGISFTALSAGLSGYLATFGTDDTEFIAAVLGMATVSVSLTFSDISAGGTMSVSVLQGPSTNFDIANGTVTHDVTVGGTEEQGFILSIPAGSPVGNLTAISVVEA